MSNSLYFSILNIVTPFLIFVGVPLSQSTSERDVLDFFCQPPLFQATFGECERNREASVRFLLYTRSSSGYGIFNLDMANLFGVWQILLRFDPLNPYTLEVNDIDNLRRSPFLRGAKIKMLIHGYIGSPDHAYPAVTRDAYLKLGGDLAVNVILVDWREAASGGIAALTRPYPISVGCTFGVARKIAGLIKYLLKENYLTLDRLHIVGHSLGSHLSALVGQEFNGNISRITGLDPSRPCYRKGDTGYAYRIGPDVARFVDIIHTDGEVGRGLGTGLIEKLGHVDFYPNGGYRRQPGCQQQLLSPFPDGGCSHGRAPELFAESIGNPLAFIGRACESWSTFRSGRCNSNEEGVMGEYAQASNFPSTFYLRTNSRIPFGMGSAGAFDSPIRN